MARHRGHNEGTISQRTYTRKDATKVTRFVAQLPIDERGKRPSLGSFETRREAREALQQAALKAAQGIVASGRPPTVREWCERWLAGRTGISYNTRAGYRTSFRAVFPYVGRVRLDRLSETDLAAMWAKLRAGEGSDGRPRRPLSAGTLKTCHRHLSAALRAAVKSRHIPVAYNPADDAKPERGKREEIRPFSEEETARLFATTSGGPFCALWVTLITTGLRRGEAQAPRWQDVDLDRQTIAVRGTIHRETGSGLVFGPPKTRRDRVVDIRPETAKLLRAQRKRCVELRLAAGPAWEDRDLVFPTETGRPLDANTIQRALDDACARVGTPDGRSRTPATPSPRSPCAPVSTRRSYRRQWATPRSPSRSTHTATSCRRCRPRPCGTWTASFPERFATVLQQSPSPALKTGVWARKSGRVAYYKKK